MRKTTIFFSRIAKPEKPSDKQYHTGTGDLPEEIWFTPAEVDETTESRLWEEIRKWELIDTYHNKYEDLAYDDRSESSGERIVAEEDLVSFLQGSYISNQIRSGYLLDHGQFAGVIIAAENTSSFGMAVTKSFDFGILFTDGTKIGRTGYHYFHCSTEISESRDSVYSLRRKEN